MGQPAASQDGERYLNATLYADYGTGFCRLSSCAA